MYAPLFQAAGIDVRYVGRYPIALLGRGTRAGDRSGGKLSPARWARNLARAAFDVLNDSRVVRAARDCDLVLLIKVDTPALIGKLRRSTRARLIYDLADVRSLEATTPGGVNEILGAVDGVTVDNVLGLEYAEEHGVSAHVWPPSAYVEAFDLHRAQSRRGRDGRVVIGWVGTPTTAANLYLVLEALEDVARKHPNVDLRLVGFPAGHDLIGRFEHVRASFRPSYDGAAMVREVIDMDIGLFPQFDLQDTAMHGITKSLIYMGGGAVVVCSPVGDNVRLVRDGENGMIATGREDWAAKLDLLIRDPALRIRLADAALKTVRRDYSLEACFAQLRRAIGV
jgi:glycosyltransferase involved in cell wall biosynthesis